MMLNVTELRAQSLRKSLLMSRRGVCLRAPCLRNNLESPRRTTKGGRVHVQESQAPSLRRAPARAGQLFGCVSEGCRCDRLRLEPGLLLSLPRRPSLRWAARSGERENEGAAPEPPALRCGNNGDAPRCDSGRQEQAQTQELFVLPLRQTCGGLRIWRRNCLSLLLHSFPCLFRYALI